MKALITGANRGIGRALLDRLPKAIGTARQASDGYKQLDVSDQDSIDALAKELNGQPIDLLVCNAGVFRDKGRKAGDEFPTELWQQTFATNVFGVFQTVQAFLPNLRLGTKPKIAIISSGLGSQKLANGGEYIYRASKAAATNIARNLAADLKSEGIAVAAYHPGWVPTDMGGTNATVSMDDSADGLIKCFNKLDIATTGSFLRFDGVELPF